MSQQADPPVIPPSDPDPAAAVADPVVPDSAAGTPAPADPAPSGSALPDPALPDLFYTDKGVPTFDAVRAKIEGRIGQSIGEAELVGESDEGKAFQEKWDKRNEAAADRLAQLRKSMHPET